MQYVLVVGQVNLSHGGVVSQEGLDALVEVLLLRYLEVVGGEVQRRQGRVANHCVEHSTEDLLGQLVVRHAWIYAIGNRQAGDTKAVTDRHYLDAAVGSC
jgi:hypothetical protein